MKNQLNIMFQRWLLHSVVGGKLDYCWSLELGKHNLGEQNLAEAVGHIKFKFTISILQVMGSYPVAGNFLPV